jgi:putative phosphoesterase
LKIVVITDVHANLPALRAVLKSINKDGYDIIVHTGDAIGIGPYPAECLDLLLNTPNIYFVMGNHDSYFSNGLPKPQPSWMSDGEVQHQLWTHAQLEPELKTRMCKWPYMLGIENDGIKATFLHYVLDVSGQNFAPLIRQPTATDLDRSFSSLNASVVFYGHDHVPRDVQGSRRYVNPDSLGCSKDANARYCTVELSRQGFTVEHLVATYDRGSLLRAFEERNVPERHFIQKIFFGINS